MADLTPAAGRQLAEHLAERLARSGGRVTLTRGGTIIYQAPAQTRDHGTLTVARGASR